MGKIKNEVGNTYGYLTVIERAPNNSENRAMWLCKCKCGNETVVMGKHLRSGNTKSCGCLNKEINSKRCLDIHKDMIGKTYGYLTVIDYGDYAIKPDGRKDRKMLCKCELCKSLTQVRASDLKNGKQIACGCINSKGNTFIKRYLENKIEYSSEYRFKDCIDERPLPFDFALFKNGSLIGLIEYQGIQHFTCENHGWDDKEKFEKVQKHDRIKKEYCEKNNIKLFYITYLENIEERLKEILNEL